MTTPHRVAALAVCLLALAAGAAAANECAGTNGIGSIKLELIEASFLQGDELAKCLPSATINVDADCNVYIGAPAADNSYVNALWSSDSTVTSYQELKLCPVNGPKVALGADAASATTALGVAVNAYVYGLNAAGTAPAKTSGFTVSVPEPGVVYFTKSSSTLKYAITATNSNTAAKFTDSAKLIVATAALLADTDLSLTEGTHYRNPTNAGLACPLGSYGLPLGDFKLCPLCPAGTTGDGFSCAACPAGKASGSVGVTNTTGCTTVCQNGKFSQAGSSDCLPCPMHTYSGSSATNGVEQCTACPTNTYAWLPGSTQCLKCTNGIPTAYTSDETDAGTPGSHILSLPQLASCSLADDYVIPAYRDCASWKTSTVTLKLALEVAGDCSITIRPISDKSCADPGANKTTLALFPRTASQNGLDANEKYTYTYNDLLIRAYYTSTTRIRTLLPSTDGGASSFMLNIDKSDTKVELKFWAATNKPDATLPASSTTGACSSNATAVGGSVATVTGTCPAGSYGSTTCTACPQGHTCAAGVASETACGADTANPYLGQSDEASDCLACNPVNTRYTSLAGADYCTVPYFDRSCDDTTPFSNGGYEWDEHNATCVQCRPGTFRSTTHISAGILDCQECPAGTYSGAGASGCTPCPTGQYSPTTGMADQQVNNNGIRCLLCPRGSIALTVGETMNTSTTTGANDFREERALSTGATTCDACPSGTWANATLTEATTSAKGCSLCPSGTYRTGDAAPENNACRRIPPGYKATDLLKATGTLGAQGIAPCEVGKYSSWSSAGARTPTAADTCQACASGSGTIAPRQGMAACTRCKAGSKPNADRTACDRCDVRTYRSFAATDTCATCPAGSETGEGRQTCSLCRPGFYMTTAMTTNDTCTACPMNKYQATPGATTDCTWCPAGKETQDTGNSECTDCPVGFYNPLTAAQSSSPACIPAPAGTFVSTTGAKLASPCPRGTYNAETAQDACEPCPPGQYANTLGNKACKVCPDGTFSGGNAVDCKPCAAGYSAAPGSGACSPCKPGTYASAARSKTCALCPRGSQCPTSATTAPRACPAGTYAPKEGSILCSPCPVNTYASTRGQNRCTPCASGTNTRGLTGQKACQAVRVTSLRRSVL